jgi:hypothetical protein
VYTRPSLRFAHRHRHGTHLRYRKAMSSAAMVFSSTFNCESAMTRPSNSRDTLRLVTRTIPTASGQGSGYPMSRCDRVALPGSWSIFWRLGSRQTDSRTLGKVRAAVVTPVPSCRRGFGTRPENLPVHHWRGEPCPSPPTASMRSVCAAAIRSGVAVSGSRRGSQHEDSVALTSDRLRERTIPRRRLCAGLVETSGAGPAEHRVVFGSLLICAGSFQ